MISIPLYASYILRTHRYHDLPRPPPGSKHGNLEEVVMPVADVVTVVVSGPAGDRGTTHARWLAKRHHWTADLPDSWGSSYGMAVRQTIGLVDVEEWFSRLEGGRTDGWARRG